MKSRRSDAVALLTVLAVPLSVAWVFPYSAIGYRLPQAKPARPAFAALVSLSAVAEQAAVKAAKTSWRNGDDGVVHLRPDLELGELPESQPVPVMPISSRVSAPLPPPLKPGRSAYLPSLAAPPPAIIRPDAASSPEPAFSRQEMLEIN